MAAHEIRDHATSHIAPGAGPRTRRLLVGAAGALTLVAGLAGPASALTPMPEPVLPMAQATEVVEPPVAPGLGELAQPIPQPDPVPVPQPQGPGGPGGFAPGGNGPDDPDPGPGGPGGFAPGGNGPDEPEPEPVPEPEVSDETAEPVAAELAFTGGDLDAAATGLALLGVGVLAAGGAAVARRRGRAA